MRKLKRWGSAFFEDGFYPERETPPTTVDRLDRGARKRTKMKVHLRHTNTIRRYPDIFAPDHACNASRCEKVPPRGEIHGKLGTREDLDHGGGIFSKFEVRCTPGGQLSKIQLSGHFLLGGDTAADHGSTVGSHALGVPNPP